MRLLSAYLIIDTVNKLLLTRSLDNNSVIDSLILNAVIVTAICRRICWETVIDRNRYFACVLLIAKIFINTF